MALKVKVKSTGEDAKALLGMSEKDKPTGTKMMPENPSSRRSETERAPVNAEKTHEAGPAYDTLTEVKSELPAGHPERARRTNNCYRDNRTNLGRGKAGFVEVE